jgi:hypothetical protein
LLLVVLCVQLHSTSGEIRRSALGLTCKVGSIAQPSLTPNDWQIRKIAFAITLDGSAKLPKMARRNRL